MKFARSARRHRIGYRHARHVMASVVPVREPLANDETALRFVGVDDRGVELEIVAIEIPAQQRVLVIHVMPTALRRKRTL